MMTIPLSKRDNTMQLSGTVLDGRTATYSLVGDNGSSSETVSLDSSSGILTYTTTPITTTTKTANYKINDGFADSATATATLNFKGDGKTGTNDCCAMWTKAFHLWNNGGAKHVCHIWWYRWTNYQFW